MLGSRIAGIIIGNLHKEELFPARRINRSPLSTSVNDLIRGTCHVGAEIAVCARVYGLL